MEEHCHSFLDNALFWVRYPKKNDIVGHISSSKLHFFGRLEHCISRPDFPPNIKKWFKNSVAGFQNKTKRSYFSPMASAVMKT